MAYNFQKSGLAFLNYQYVVPNIYIMYIIKLQTLGLITDSFHVGNPLRMFGLVELVYVCNPFTNVYVCGVICVYIDLHMHSVCIY